MKTGANTNFDFDALARDYDRWYETPTGRNHDLYQKLLVLDFLKPNYTNTRLLDVGCGTGHWSAFFASLGLEVTGVDISAEMVEIARSKNLHRCSFRIGDAYELPFDDGFFSIAAAMTTLEFVEYPDRILSEMLRCTEPGGVFIIGTLNRRSLFNRQRITQCEEPYISGKLFSSKKLRRLLEMYGAVRMKCSSEDYPKSGLGFTRMLRCWPYQSEGACIVAQVNLGECARSRHITPLISYIPGLEPLFYLPDGYFDDW